MRVKKIPINKIKYPPVMLRQVEDMTGIDDLAWSIEVNGLINPITVRPADEEYILLAGGRRLEAVKKLGWDTIPANVIEPPAGMEPMITLAENQSRVDVNPLELAQYYQYLNQEVGLSQDEIGRLTGTTGAHVNQILKLLTLDEYTMGALAAGDISPSQARELARLPDVDYRQYLVNVIRDAGASVLMVKRWVDERIGFISKREEFAARPAYVEPASRVGGSKQLCAGCGSEVAGGGLQALMLCPDCFALVKRTMEAEGEQRQ